MDGTVTVVADRDHTHKYFMDKFHYKSVMHNKHNIIMHQNHTNTCIHVRAFIIRMIVQVCNTTDYIYIVDIVYTMPTHTVGVTSHHGFPDRPMCTYCGQWVFHAYRATTHV